MGEGPSNDERWEVPKSRVRIISKEIRKRRRGKTVPGLTNSKNAPGRKNSEAWTKAFTWAKEAPSGNPRTGKKGSRGSRRDENLLLDEVGKWLTGGESVLAQHLTVGGLCLWGGKGTFEGGGGGEFQ